MQHYYLMIHIIPIPAFNDNYIWLIRREKTRSVAIVDPGTAAPVLDYLQAEQLSLNSILITHHHADHQGGALELLKHYPNATVYGPKTESIHGMNKLLVEGDQIQLAELAVELAVLDVPGHTAGHIAYYNEDYLFCGDTLFAAGCGRLFEGTPAQMLASLSKISQLNPHTRVYCAHEYTLKNIAFARLVEPDNDALLRWEQEAKQLRANDQPTLPSLLSRELAANPFLRCHHKNVQKTAETKAKKPLATPVEVFKIIRDWKDQF